MTEEDIKRQLECRMAIDKHQDFKKEYYKTNKTTMITVNGVTKKYEPELVASTLEMNNMMKKNGFNNAADFMKWYKSNIFEVFKECYPISGYCDRCGLKEVRYQPCYTYGKAFHTDKTGWCGESIPTSAPEVVYAIAWKIGNLNGCLEKDSVIVGDRMDPPKWALHCLPGHGFHILLSEIKTPPEGIDLFWKPMVV